MPFLIIIPIILIIILVVYLKRPETRGRRGENRVKWVIGETIENDQYVINDLILMNDGKTTQIDHIVINPRGVFVIETKNYSGEIYGNENQREWTQVLAYTNSREQERKANIQIWQSRICGRNPLYLLRIGKNSAWSQAGHSSNSYFADAQTCATYD